MCTELSLAILYFITIFSVNFFLLKVLKNYIVNIIYLQQLKNIFVSFPEKNELKLLSLLYLFLKKDMKNRNLLISINSVTDIEDSLIIGNIYLNLLKNQENRSAKRISENFYFQLLQNQYLSNKINLK
jgi:hypothetical protein